MDKRQEALMLHAQANEYATKAGNAHSPNPMIVHSPTQDYYVSEGLCGFAWISLRGTTSFARQMIKENIARRGYPSGVQIWVYQYNQSWERKVAYAKAYAEFLNQKGIDATWGERVD